jgi:hypothetical protein
VTAAVVRRALILTLLCATGVPAQTAVRVRVDNDAFNFWLGPWDRPDEEYSSGVRLSADWAGSAFWSGSASHDALGCSPDRSRCATHTFTLGQDIYTAARHIGDPTPAPGSRPDAGLLWLQESQRISRADRLDETSVTIGVTGEPALASSIQRIVHGYAPGWQRPIDWSKQLPFSTVVGIAYDHTQLWALDALEVQPHAGATVGNLLTEARAGIGLRTGWNLRDAFRPTAPSDRFEFAFVGDAALRAVAWSAVLAGDAFGTNQRVTLRPIVPELQLGFTMRYRRGSVAYIVHQTSAEYTTRNSAHQWSTIQAEWQFGR